MPQLLVELFSEEIPARMQSGAARELDRAARDHLARADLGFEHLTAYAGPRRLTLVVDGLPARQDDRVDERRGPRIGAPDAAVAGFLRSAGVAREELIEREGVWYASISRQGRPTADVVAEMMPGIIESFPWPKSMVWGDGSLRWVRPLHRILCVFDGDIVRFSVGGIESGDVSEGHRSMGSMRPFRAHGFDDYRAALDSHFVVLEVQERKRRIIDGARALCLQKGLVLVEDDDLVEEVAGMVEWPTPLLGGMDGAFLALPPEVIRTTMRTHQRYFAVRDAKGTGALAPWFVAVANIAADDGGALIAAGNARVLSARLQDARFFWGEDLKHRLESRLERLKGVTFHAKLGSMYERVERIEKLARAIAPQVGADPDLTGLAARLAKADLVTAMVGEFPELQGIMGGYYASAEGQDGSIADAIRDQYKPQGPSDGVPSAPVTMAVALADKIDTVLAFFSIDEKPTGSRDPFALRRAALGIIRIVLENRLRVPLTFMVMASSFHGGEVKPFFDERLKVLLRERGVRHDLVDAVFALSDDDYTRVVARIETLTAFLATEDGADLLAAYKRAGNILNAEVRKDPLPQGSSVRPPGPPEELALFDTLHRCRPALEASLAAEDFPAALAGLASLCGPVNGFFDGVLVNSSVAAERDNRLRLLGEVREVVGRVADFSLISG